MINLLPHSQAEALLAIYDHYHPAPIFPGMITIKSDLGCMDIYNNEFSNAKYQWTIELQPQVSVLANNPNTHPSTVFRWQSNQSKLPKEIREYLRVEYQKLLDKKT